MKRKCTGSGGRPAAALLTAILALVLAGCDDGSSSSSSDSGSGGTGGGGVSFTLAKSGSNGFTITVAGADWKDLNGRITDEAMSTNAPRAQLISFLDWSGLTINTNTSLNNNVKARYFNYSVSGKVLTAAAVTDASDTYHITAISGTLKFTANTTALKTLARIITTASTADSATGSPAGGITF